MLEIENLPERFDCENALVQEADTVFAAKHSYSVRRPLTGQNLHAMIRHALREVERHFVYT